MVEGMKTLIVIGFAMTGCKSSLAKLFYLAQSSPVFWIHLSKSTINFSVSVKCLKHNRKLTVSIKLNKLN